LSPVFIFLAIFVCFLNHVCFDFQYGFVLQFVIHILLIDFRTHEAIDSLLALVTIMLMVCDVDPLQRDIENNIEPANPIVFDNLSFLCR